MSSVGISGSDSGRSSFGGSYRAVGGRRGQRGRFSTCFGGRREIGARNAAWSGISDVEICSDRMLGTLTLEGTEVFQREYRNKRN